MSENQDQILDISVALSDQTIIYPGDPIPEYCLVSSQINGDTANVGYLKLCIHNGTHVDVPYHFRDDGRTLEQMPLDHWMGPALVVDVTAADRCVKASDLEGVPLQAYARILLKTKNSHANRLSNQFNEDFIFLDKSACDRMVAAGVKTVGLDYITVDPLGSVDFPAHRALLGHDICIIEHINLKDVDPGVYFLMCLPLKLVGTDGAPARVVLLKPGFCV
ncbi:MAG: cyclase family protein [Bacillota bacterium]|nr:cyclase family protein [Bacillota bacterium]